MLGSVFKLFLFIALTAVLFTDAQQQEERQEVDTLEPKTLEKRQWWSRYRNSYPEYWRPQNLLPPGFGSSRGGWYRSSPPIDRPLIEPLWPEIAPPFIPGPWLPGGDGIHGGIGWDRGISPYDCNQWGGGCWGTHG